MRSQCCGAAFAILVDIQSLLYISILVLAKTTGNSKYFKKLYYCQKYLKNKPKNEMAFAMHDEM